MPVYLFRCPCGQEHEIRRPMEQAGEPASCPCGQPMKRVFTRLPIMVRPEGWNLRPDEPGYSKLPLKDKEPRPLCHQ
jgi:putative FmdB family regulatory protein